MHLIPKREEKLADKCPPVHHALPQAQRHHLLAWQLLCRNCCCLLGLAVQRSQHVTHLRSVCIPAAAAAAAAEL
jgi:hypothetical protein